MAGGRFAAGIGGRDALMLLVALSLAVFVAYLVFANYAAARRLRQSLCEQALGDAQQQAQPLRDFVVEQLNTIADLASSAEVLAYRENQSLGMSPEYGLRQSLLLIGERFDQLRERKHIAAGRVFSRLSYLDRDGAVLATSAAEDASADTAGLVFDVDDGNQVSLSADHRSLRLMTPVHHRRKLAGHVVAWIDVRLLCRVAGCDLKRDHASYLLLASDPRVPLGPYRYPPLEAQLPIPVAAETMLMGGPSGDPSLVIAVPVRDLPFALATQHPSSVYLGADPWHSLVAMIVLGVLLMGVAAVLVAQVVRGRKLSEMLSAMRLREAVEAERNRANLDRERSARTQAEEERFQLGYAIEQAAESVVITDTQGIIIYVNRAFTQVSGWSREDAVGQTPRILRSGVHDQAFYERMWRELTGGRAWHGRIVNRRRDGTLFHEDATISPVREADGSVRRYIAVKRDVTELMRMEEQLRQAQKLESIGQLAAGIAHEINTPIQFIGDNLRFLSDGFSELQGMVPRPASSAGKPADDQDLAYLMTEIPKALSESQDGIRRVSQIVLAMKEFSHPSGQGVTPTDINRAIASTVTVSRNEWKYVAELVQELDPGMPQVPLLPGDFNQVVLNLIVNAAHAIADRRKAEGSTAMGRITVSTRVADGMAEVRIGDDGCGIPDAVKPRIFEPFFTTKEVGRGTGQGLALAHAVVVKKLGGRISFESRIGVGTTFIIRLPLKS